MGGWPTIELYGNRLLVLTELMDKPNWALSEFPTNGRKLRLERQDRGHSRRHMSSLRCRRRAIAHDSNQPPVRVRQAHTYITPCGKIHRAPDTLRP